MRVGSVLNQPTVGCAPGLMVGSFPHKTNRRAHSARYACPLAMEPTHAPPPSRPPPKPCLAARVSPPARLYLGCSNSPSRLSEHKRSRAFIRFPPPKNCCAAVLHASPTLSHSRGLGPTPCACATAPGELPRSYRTFLQQTHHRVRAPLPNALHPINMHNDGTAQLGSVWPTTTRFHRASTKTPACVAAGSATGDVGPSHATSPRNAPKLNLAVKPGRCRAACLVEPPRPPLPNLYSYTRWSGLIMTPPF
jgi:hypothetical protein